ncbi:MAG: hypothetical protein CFE33_11100 [Pseudorhodobacter sp. PARRP1]|nr:MAG: hypothetical protein CFE33_11100 [Pseudorhodobacter sp. PARRP1]
MRGLWIAVWLGFGGMAAADPYCKPNAAELAALPGMLAGDWQGQIMQGVAVQAGVPHVLPASAAPQQASFLLSTEGLVFSDRMLAQAIVMGQATSKIMPHFELPGESVLGPEELLGDALRSANVDCLAQDLPQFVGQAAMPNGLTATFHSYALSADLMLLVMQVGQLGPVAKADGDGARVLMRYTR